MPSARGHMGDQLNTSWSAYPKASSVNSSLFADDASGLDVRTTVEPLLLEIKVDVAICRPWSLEFLDQTCIRGKCRNHQSYAGTPAISDATLNFSSMVHHI